MTYISIHIYINLIGPSKKQNIEGEPSLYLDQIENSLNMKRMRSKTYEVKPVDSRVMERINNIAKKRTEQEKQREKEELNKQVKKEWLIRKSEDIILKRKA